MKLKKMIEVEIGRRLWLMLNDQKIKMKKIVENTDYTEQEIRNYIKIYSAQKNYEFAIQHNYGSLQDKFEYEQKDIRDYFKPKEEPIEQKQDKIDPYKVIEMYFGKNWDKDDDD